MKLFATYDFETRRDTRPIAVCVYWGHEKHVLVDKTSHNAVLDFTIHYLQVAANRGCRYAYAHNGGMFDHAILSHRLIERRIPFEAQMSGSRIVTQDVRFPSGARLTLRDSYALLPTSLASLLEAFDVQGKTFNKRDYETGIENLPDNDIASGVTRDTVALHEMLEKAFAMLRHHKAPVRSTYSSTAFQALKHYTGPVPKIDKSVQEDCRKAYRGGRVEVFKTGGPDVTEFDVNSLYPYVMHAFPHPWEYLGRLDASETPSETDIVLAKVNVPPMHVPPLAVTPPGRRGPWFPTGAWQGWYTGRELLYAQSLGCSFRVVRGHKFRQTSSFGPFVEDFYAMRSLSPAHKVIGKYLLNGAQGKFGQKPERETVESYRDPLAAFRAARKSCGRLLSPFVAVVPVERWSRNTHFALASSILATARIVLHKHLVSVPSELLFYCDTDSIHCQFQLESGEGLGSLKRLETLPAWYLAPKLYARGESVHAKGFPRTLTKAQLRLLKKGASLVSLLGENGVWSPRGLKSIVKKGLGLKDFNKRLRFKTLPKRLTVNEKGETRAWTFSELECIDKA